jgi:hypothetical protein
MGSSFEVPVAANLNLDGFIDVSDVTLVGSRFGKACDPPG